MSYPTTITRQGSCDSHTCCEATYSLVSCSELTAEAQVRAILEGTALDSESIDGAIMTMKDEGIIPA